MVGTSNQSVPEMAIDIGHIGFPTLHGSLGIERRFPATYDGALRRRAEPGQEHGQRDATVEDQVGR
jgi:hypothetical protein